VTLGPAVHTWPGGYLTYQLVYSPIAREHCRMGLPILARGDRFGAVLRALLRRARTFFSGSGSPTSRSSSVDYPAQGAALYAFTSSLNSLGSAFGMRSVFPAATLVTASQVTSTLSSPIRWQDQGLPPLTRRTQHVR